MKDTEEMFLEFRVVYRGEIINVYDGDELVCTIPEEGGLRELVDCDGLTEFLCMLSLDRQAEREGKPQPSV